jgi:hypothetical protein
MPIFKDVKTLGSEKIWEKGDRTIWKLKLEVQGNEMECKTYSKVISELGWSGDVETREQNNDVFVKQYKEEDGYTPSGNAGSPNGRAPSSRPNSTSSGRSGGDDFTMYLSYAKDLTVALINSGKDLKELPDIISTVALAGEQLYDAHNSDGEKKSESDVDISPEELNKLFPITEEHTVE